MSGRKKECKQEDLTIDEIVKAYVRVAPEVISDQNLLKLYTKYAEILKDTPQFSAEGWAIFWVVLQLENEIVRRMHTNGANSQLSWRERGWTQ